MDKYKSTDTESKFDNESGGEELIHLMDYWRIVYKRLPLVLVIIAIVVFAGAMISYNIPKTYRAGVTVQVTREDKVIDIDPFNRTYRGDKFWLRTEYEMITSEAVIEQVVDELNLVEYFQKRKVPNLISNLSDQLNVDLKKLKSLLKKEAPKKDMMSEQERAMRRKEAVVKQVSSMINSEPSEDTTLISISVTTVEDPELAAAIANKLAEVYGKFKINNKLKTISSGIKTLQVQYNLQEKDVNAQRQRVKEIQSKYKLTNLPGQEITRNNDEEISRLKGLLAEARVELNMKVTMGEKLKSMTPEHLEEAIGVLIDDKQDYMNLKNELNRSIVEFELIHMDLGEKHPKVMKAKKRMEALRKQMTDRMGGIKGGFNAQLEQIKTKVKGLEEELKKLQTEYSGNRAGQISEYNTAVKILKAKEAILDALRTKITEETISMELPRTGISMILQKAVAPLRPSGPNTTRNLVVTLFLAVMVSFGAAFFLEYLDNSVTRIDELEKMTSSQVISAIPQLKTKNLMSDLNDKYAEVFRQMRTNLVFGSPDGAKVFSVQSSNPGEGKSTVSAKLAEAFAESGARVLVIDCDLRRPNLHNTLQCGNAHGVTDVLAQDCYDGIQYVQSTAIENVYALTSGSVKGSAFTKLTTDKLSQILDSVRDSYDYIFVDSPPVMLVNESLIIANSVDSNIVVVQYNKFPKSVISRCVQKLRSSGANISGFVLNKVNIKTDTYYYYHYYEHKYYKSNV